MQGRYSNNISDYPFKGVIDSTVGAVMYSWWDNAITEIWKSVNYNNVVWYNPLTYPSNIRRDQIDVIITAYYNLIKKDSSYPEYDAYKALKGDKNIWNLIKAVSAKSGQTIELVRQSLDQLEYGTKDGRIATNQFLYPRTWENNEESRRVPEDVDAVANSNIAKTAQKAFDILSFVTRNIIPIAIIGGGLYVAKKTGVLDKGFSAIKKKVSGNKGLSDGPIKRQPRYSDRFTKTSYSEDRPIPDKSQTELF